MTMKTKVQDKQSEIRLFNRVALRYDAEELYDKAGIELALDGIDELQINLAGAYVLEAGCASGVVGRALLERRGAIQRMIGVDISPIMVEMANNAKDRPSNYMAIEGDLDNRELFAPGSFDVVLCAHILHHFPSPWNVLVNMSTWLKPGGHIILIETNGNNFMGRVAKLAKRIFSEGFIAANELSTSNETDHTVKVYRTLLCNCGCSVTTVVGLYSKTEYSQGGVWWLRLILNIRTWLYRAQRRLLWNNFLTASALFICGRKK